MNNDADNWWKALEGDKEVDLPADEKTVVEQIRSAVADYESKLLGDDYNVAAEFERLKSQLSTEHQTPSKNLDSRGGAVKFPMVNWKQFAAVFSGSFATGALVMRFALTPTVELARTGGDFIDLDGTSAQRIELYIDSPSNLVLEVLEGLDKANLKFTLSADRGRYSLLVYDLIPYAPEQMDLKVTLGISESASGNVLFEVMKPSNEPTTR